MELLILFMILPCFLQADTYTIKEMNELRTCEVQLLPYKPTIPNPSYNVFYPEIVQEHLPLDCTKYKNDYKILKSFPFHVSVDPSSEYPEITYAKTNENGNIYYLNIVNEKLVPCAIFCLSNLQELYVRGTPFYDSNFQLPSEIELFANSLTDLIINGSNMTHLPKQIGRLKKLRYLEISNTGLMSLPDAIGDLSALTILDLSDNKLTELTTSIKKLRLLQLTLNNNMKLRSIQSLNGLPSLTTLKADNCSIEDLPLDLPQLTNLYMSNNNLTDLLGIRTLGDRTNRMKSFHFNKNHIRFIPYQIQFVKNLDRLNLNNNQLRYLPPVIFNIPTLSYLFIQNNSFFDMKLKKIVTMFKITNPNLKLLV